MPTKSIISIEIDDSDFQRFAANFARYQEKLKEQPHAWNDVAASAAAAAASAAAMGAAVGAAAVEIHKTNAEAERAAYHSGRTSTFWGQMAQNAGKFASRVYEATRSLLRWGELTGLISGIIGGGGLFGIDRLAIGAGERRKKALGLGVTPGEAQAFEVNYGRVVDPEAFLSNVNEMLHDVTKRHGLYGAGLTEQDLKGKDTAEVGADLLTHLKDIADRTPESMMANVLDKQLQNVVSLQEFERIKNTPRQELGEYRENYRRDIHALELPQATAKAWQDLQVQFHRGAETLENVFIKGLTNLTGPLGHLSEAFTKLVEDVLASKVLREWIDDLAKGIKWLGDYIGSAEFRTDIIYFLEAVDRLGHKTIEFVEKVVTFIDTLADATLAVKNFFTDPLGKIKEGGSNGPPEEGNADAPGSYSFQRRRHPEWFNDNGTLKEGIPGGAGDWLPLMWRTTPPIPPTPAPTPEQKLRFDELEGGFKLPPGILNATMQAESHGDPNATSTTSSAKGQFQFLDATAKQYGVDNPRDFNQSSLGAAKYFQKLLDEFHGDLNKAVAGYTWGEGNVEKAVSDYGDKWRRALPAEKERYVEQVVAGQANAANPQPKFVPEAQNRPPLTIRLYPQPGGNPITSTSQLAY